MKYISGIIVLSALAAGTASADFLDEFSSPALDPGWRIAWEDTNYWSLTERPGFLRIQTQFFTVNPVNFFMHFEGIAGDFSVTARLICQPDSAGQAATLWADYDSLGQTPWAVVGIGNYLGFGTVVLAMLADTFSGAFYPDTLVYLRIRTNSDTVFADYSPDDQTWTVIRSAYNPLFHEHQRSGLMAINQADLGATPQTPAMNADFDWLHLISLSDIEEQAGQTVKAGLVTPNPFVGFGRAAGRELEYFALYDVSGHRVGIFRGDRLAQGLAPGVYFVRAGGDACATARIVKIR